MSIECGYCERDLRGPHADDCPRITGIGLISALAMSEIKLPSAPTPLAVAWLEDDHVAYTSYLEGPYKALRTQKFARLRTDVEVSIYLFSSDQMDEYARAAVEQDRAGRDAELHLLEEVCAFYANDEDRFLRGEGEPYGSIPTEVGMKARSARARFDAREAGMAEQQAQRRPMKDWEISERVEEIERWNQMQTQRRPLTNEQVRKEFAKKYPADDVLLTLVEKGCVHELEAIRARARLELFEAGARSVEHGIGEQA